MNKRCHLVILILLSFTISLSLGQTVSSISIQNNYPPGYNSINYVDPSLGMYSNNTRVSQDFSSTTYESLLFDIYNETVLNSALIDNNCAAISNEFFLYNISYINPLGSVAFYVNFNDPKSITEGTVTVPLYIDNIVFTPLLGLLLCTNFSKELIFFEGYLQNLQYTFQSFMYNGIYSIVEYGFTTLPIKNIFFGQIFIISPVGLATYQFPNGFSIIAIANGTIMATVQYYTTNPTSFDPPGKTSYGQFVVIEIQNEINGTVELNASLTFTYTQYDPTLMIGHLDDFTNAWSFSTIPPTINKTANTVTQNTTHFSTWGLYGETATAPSLSPLYLFSITLIITLVLSFK